MKNATCFGKYSRLMIVLSILLCSPGCNKGGGDNNSAPATSQICNQVTGVEAIYWDLMNGIARTDIPGGVPMIKTTGGTYIHPSYPPLTFIYPTGYTPYTDQTSGAVGVTLQRNDNKSIWYYTSIFTSGTTTPQAVLNTEITQLRSFYNSTGTVQTVCSQQGSQPRAAGITSDFASAFIRFDGITATVNVTITTEVGLGAIQINVMLTAAPTDQFVNEALNTYLPIDYQLLYKDNGQQDSDGDGYPDTTDGFPYDPSRH